MTAHSERKRWLTPPLMSALLALFLVFGAVQPAPAGSYQGDGTYTGTPSPVVTALFAAFPNGGDGLMAALRDLIIRNPALADDVAYVGSRSNAAQQAAAGAGMAQAYTALINRGDSNAASRVVSAAQQSASSPIQSAMTRAVGVTIGSNSYQQGGTAKTPCTPAGTVSPTC